jgi:hypothetical protein
MFIFSNNGGRKNLNHLRKDVDYWHRPGGAISEIVIYCKQNSIDDFRDLDNNYKEIYIGSLFLILLERVENKKFYISKTKNDPPDFVFMFLKKDEKDRLWLTSREVEIVRNVNNISELEKIVLSKDKFYPKDITILCYVETGGIADLIKISQSVCSKLKNISDIFILFHGGMMADINEIDEKTVSLVQISPDYISYSNNIDLINEIEKFKKDIEKLIYVKDTGVYYGKKTEGEKYPNIIKN